MKITVEVNVDRYAYAAHYGLEPGDVDAHIQADVQQSARIHYDAVDLLATTHK